MEDYERLLEIVHDDAASLADKQKTDPEAFASIRRNGFGASDSATLLQLSPWVSISELLQQKCATQQSEAEKEIGTKPSVRMGVDLEPLILSKFEDWLEDSVYLFLLP